MLIWVKERAFYYAGLLPLDAAFHDYAAVYFADAFHSL